MRFAKDDPFGESRADLRAGVVAATISKVMGGNRSAKPIDFMPIVKEQMRKAEEVSEALRQAKLLQSLTGSIGRRVRVVDRRSK